MKHIFFLAFFLLLTISCEDNISSNSQSAPIIDMIPPKKYYLKYIKGRKATEYDEWLMELIIKEYMCSSKEACDYLEILYNTREGREQIKSICEKYGIDKKQITSLKLKI